MTTRVVEDRLFLDGFLEERTSDYYAQDVCGNVWYFGEDTAELDRRGHVVSTEGSFHAGVDGAEPGVFMQARPQVGRAFRQEWYDGHAETCSQWPIAAAPASSCRTGRSPMLCAPQRPRRWSQGSWTTGTTFPDRKVKEVSISGPNERLVLVDVLS